MTYRTYGAVESLIALSRISTAEFMNPTPQTTNEPIGLKMNGHGKNTVGKCRLDRIFKLFFFNGIFYY